MLRLTLLSTAVLCPLAISVSGDVARVPQRTTEVVAAGVPRDPSAVGYLNLHKRHPDGDAGPVEFNTYTARAALVRMGQINGFLASFARLTRKAETVLTRADLAAVGNTEADMQTIGFQNIPLTVEGTLLKQDYQLRQVQYELAQLKFARKEVSAVELADAKRAYADATRRLQIFWDTRLPTD